MKLWVAIFILKKTSANPLHALFIIKNAKGKKNYM